MKNKRVAFLAVATIVFACAMVCAFINYPHGIKPYTPYILACFMLFLSVNSIYEGRQKIQIARDKREKIAWYQQNMITLGLMYLMLGLFEGIVLGFGNSLPNAEGDVFGYVCAFLFGIPFIIFCALSLKASLAGQRKLRDQQEKEEGHAEQTVVK